MSVFEYLFEIRPAGRGWSLTAAGHDQDLRFETYLQAEQRARWLAVRQEVRGFPTRIRILDATGGVVGWWRGELYQAAAASDFSQAA